MNDVEGIRRTYASATRLMAFLFFPLCLIGAALTPIILPLLFGSDFFPAVPNAMVLMIFSLLSIANVGSALVYGLERSSFIALSGSLGAVMAVAMSLIVIPSWGAWGAVWSRGFVQTSMIALGTWYISSCLEVPVPLKQLGRLFLSAVISAATSYTVIAWHGSSMSLIVAVPLGVIAYLLLVRVLGGLEPEDSAVLTAISTRLPRLLSKPGALFLSWLSPMASR